MQKSLLYIAAFVVLVLLQIFLIDNIALSVYFHPLVYVAFVIMLPLDMKPVWVLLCSTLMGLTIDTLTGMAGINVMATAAVGFLRPALLHAAVGRSTDAADTIPALHRLSTKHLAWFIVLVVVLHSVIYFFMESLSLSNALHTFVRLVVSDIVAIALIWYIIKLFTEKIITR
ncbi:MAG: rod shape-determining protein MreD [Alistipes sp.]|nr:rod shape-determining protein MreD [Alistipes sp.]